MRLASVASGARGGRHLRMTAQAKTRLSLGEALEDFGWFALVFTMVVGGTSVLALLETVFVEHRLIALFQWIVDGYDRIATVVGAMVEPLLQPVVDWLNAQFDLRLELAPHWRPLFILGMVLVVGLARTAWRAGHKQDAILALLVIGAGALVGAVVSGLMPLAGGWWAQGLAAAAPTMALFTFFGAAAALSGGDPADRTPLRMAALFIVIAGVVAFVLGAALSFVPGLSTGAGVIALAVIIAVFGAGFLWGGLAGNDSSDATLGLTILGGFVSAALIVAADLIVKAVG
jgi:hypothetical protein